MPLLCWTRNYHYRNTFCSILYYVILERPFLLFLFTCIVPNIAKGLFDFLRVSIVSQNLASHFYTRWNKVETYGRKNWSIHNCNMKSDRPGKFHDIVLSYRFSKKAGNIQPILERTQFPRVYFAPWNFERVQISIHFLTKVYFYVAKFMETGLFNSIVCKSSSESVKLFSSWHKRTDGRPGRHDFSYMCWGFTPYKNA